MNHLGDLLRLGEEGDAKLPRLRSLSRGVVGGERERERPALLLHPAHKNHNHSQQQLVPRDPHDQSTFDNINKAPTSVFYHSKHVASHRN
jgi:hypothetical protein